MHEKALMDDLMAKILGVAAAEGGARVTRVTVWLGALSHFTPEHFREHFDDAARGTLAEGAEVEATLDDDLADPRAQGVVLESVVVVRLSGSISGGDGRAGVRARTGTTGSGCSRWPRCRKSSCAWRWALRARRLEWSRAHLRPIPSRAAWNRISIRSRRVRGLRCRIETWSCTGYLLGFGVRSPVCALAAPSRIGGFTDCACLLLPRSRLAGRPR